MDAADITGKILNMGWMVLVAALRPYFSSKIKESWSQIQQRNFCSPKAYVAIFVMIGIIMLLMVEHLGWIKEETLNKDVAACVTLVRFCVNQTITAAIFTLDFVQNAYNKLYKYLSKKFSRSKHLKSMVESVGYFFIGLLPINEAIRVQCFGLLITAIYYYIAYKLGIKLYTAILAIWIFIISLSAYIMMYEVITASSEWFNTLKGHIINGIMFGLLLIVQFTASIIAIFAMTVIEKYRNMKFREFAYDFASIWAAYMTLVTVKVISIYMQSDESITAMDGIKYSVITTIASFITAKIINKMGKREKPKDS